MKQDRTFEYLRWAAFIFLAATIQLPTSHVYFKPGVYAVLALAALFDLVWNFVMPKRLRGANIRTEIAFDLVWITLIQLPTGQIHSPFSFLFALPVLNAALVLDRRGVTNTGIAAAIILVPILFAHLWGDPLDLNHFFSYAVRFALIFICGFLGGLLARGEADGGRADRRTS